MAAWSAWAADWSASSTFGQEVEFDDNIEVDVDSPGNVFGSTSSVLLDITAEAPRYTLNFGGNLEYREFVGPGSPTEVDPLSERVDGDLEIRRPTYILALSALYARRGTTFTDNIEDFDELGVVTVNADRMTYSVGSSVSVNIDRTNSLSVTGAFRSVDFDVSADALDPFIDIDLSASWQANLTGRTSATLGGSVSLFDADNAEESESQTVSMTAGVTTSITPRLSASGSAGLNVIRSSEIGVGGEIITTSVGPLFSVGLQYAMGASEFSISASQSTSASALGDLQDRRSIRIGVNHQVNRREAFRINGSLTTQSAASSGDEGTTFASFSPTYSFTLSRYWTLEVGYQLRYLDTDTGSGLSNKVFGTLSREFVLLP